MKNEPKNRIMFVDPCNDYYGLNSSGIAFLRGYLKERGISSAVVSFAGIFSREKANNRINRELDGFNKYLFSLVREKDNKASNPKDHQLLQRMFIHYYPDRIWESVKKLSFLEDEYKKILAACENFKYIGISLGYYLSPLYSLSLAQSIKKLFPNTKTILGGEFVLVNHQVLARLLSRNAVFDYLVIGEGEVPLALLLQGKNPDKIPNLIYLKDRLYERSSNLTYSKEITNLPAPLFEPADVLYLQASRECYWGRCVFCIREENTDFKLRPIRRGMTKAGFKNPKSVVREAMAIAERIGDKELKFFFTDPSLPINFLKGFSEEINRKKSIRLISNLSLGLIEA